MTTAVFGGTFDPPHKEHENIIRITMRELCADRYIVIPNGNPPHKAKIKVTPASDRLNMTRLAFGDIPGVEISGIEAESLQPCYTCETLKRFSTSDNKPYFVLGADSVANMDKWKNPDEIAALATLVAVGRDGVKEDFLYPVVRSSYCGANVSSTEIRIKLEFGCRDVPVRDVVLEYIDKNRLYSDYAVYIDEVKKRISPERFAHTMYTAIMAVKLNSRHELGVPFEKLFIACILHDIAKSATREDAERYGLSDSQINSCGDNVLHAYLGAKLAAKLFPELDEDIISAIKYHTTFRAGMTPIEKLVAIADCVEESRRYNGVEQLRADVMSDIDRGILSYLEITIARLQKKGVPIDENTPKARDYFKEIVIDASRRNG